LENSYGLDFNFYALIHLLKKKFLEKVDIDSIIHDGVVVYESTKRFVFYKKMHECSISLQTERFK